jgi:hypothetical protein
MSKYVVFLNAPPLPYRGYSLEAIKIPKSKTFDDIRDLLPPTLVNHVEVEADNIHEAKAVGLAKLVNGD